MRYQHVLVAVAVTPESHRLVEKAVSLVKPHAGRITLLTLVSDPELYNQLAAPMMENLRDLMLEETQRFLNELTLRAGWPIQDAIIAHGELSEHILALCQQHDVDLVICGNHNKSVLNKITCSARRVVASSQVDVLLVAL